MKIYIAASLFTRSERKWNRLLADALLSAMPGLEIVLPQDFTTGSRCSENQRNKVLFRMCIECIASSDAVVALMEGVEVDSGTAWEMGYAFARNTPVIGVRTDCRPGAEHGVNIMLSRGCRFLVEDYSVQEEDIGRLAKDIARRLKQIAASNKTAKK